MGDAVQTGGRRKSRTSGLRFRKPSLYPSELCDRIMVIPAGFQPATLSLENSRSVQLSYGTDGELGEN